MSTPWWKENTPSPRSASADRGSANLVRGSPKFPRTGCASLKGFSGHGYAPVWPSDGDRTVIAHSAASVKRTERSRIVSATSAHGEAGLEVPGEPDVTGSPGGSTALYGVSSGKVPSGPAGAGSFTEAPPGTGFPATPLTDWVENANVS